MSGTRPVSRRMRHRRDRSPFHPHGGRTAANGRSMACPVDRSRPSLGSAGRKQRPVPRGRHARKRRATLGDPLDGSVDLTDCLWRRHRAFRSGAQGCGSFAQGDGQAKASQGHALAGCACLLRRSEIPQCHVGQRPAVHLPHGIKNKRSPWHALGRD